MQVEIKEDEEVPSELRCGETSHLRTDSGHRYCMRPAFMVVLVSHMRKGGRPCR